MVYGCARCGVGRSDNDRTFTVPPIVSSGASLAHYNGPNSPVRDSEEVIGHDYDEPGHAGVRENEAGTRFGNGRRVARGIALGAGLILGGAILYQVAIKYFSSSQPAQVNIPTHVQRSSK